MKSILDFITEGQATPEVKEKIKELEKLAKEAFCLENCAIHIQRVFRRELNIDMTVEEIKEGIRKLYSKGKRDNKSICKVFNLSNVGSVASIISLLLS